MGEPRELGGGRQTTPGEVGEVGRTPIPMAESTRQPVVGGQSPWPTTEPVTKLPDSPRMSGEEKRPTIILSKKSTTNQPTSHHAGGEMGEPLGQEGTREEEPSPPMLPEVGDLQLPPSMPVILNVTEEQRQIIAAAREKKRRALWARNCILRLRQDRDEMEENLVHLYETKAQDEHVSRAVLREVRDVFVRKYTDVIHRISQAVQDFYLNQEMDYEEELDFPPDSPVDLTRYPEGYIWTEGEYLRLRFAALCHESSWAHLNEAYTYMLHT